MEPIYAENIIVGVVYEKIFSWYVTNKEIWFLDYNIWSEAFDVCDENSNYDDCIERRGIPVVNCTTAKQFLNNLSDYQITANELRKKLQDKRAKQEDLEDYLDFSPSLYVDFDKKSCTLYFQNLHPLKTMFQLDGMECMQILQSTFQKMKNIG